MARIPARVCGESPAPCGGAHVPVRGARSPWQPCGPCGEGRGSPARGGRDRGSRCAGPAARRLPLRRRHVSFRLARSSGFLRPAAPAVPRRPPAVTPAPTGVTSPWLASGDAPRNPSAGQVERRRTSPGRCFTFWAPGPASARASARRLRTPRTFPGQVGWRGLRGGGRSGGAPCTCPSCARRGSGASRACSGPSAGVGGPALRAAGEGPAVLPASQPRGRRQEEPGPGGGPRPVPRCSPCSSLSEPPAPRWAAAVPGPPPPSSRPCACGRAPPGREPRRCASRSPAASCRPSAAPLPCPARLDPRACGS